MQMPHPHSYAIKQRLLCKDRILSGYRLVVRCVEAAALHCMIDGCNMSYHHLPKLDHGCLVHTTDILCTLFIAYEVSMGQEFVAEAPPCQVDLPVLFSALLTKNEQPASTDRLCLLEEDPVA